METKDKNSSEESKSRTSAGQAKKSDGKFGHQNSDAASNGKKTGANRDEDTEPKGEDEHN